MIAPHKEELSIRKTQDLLSSFNCGAKSYRPKGQAKLSGLSSSGSVATNGDRVVAGKTPSRSTADIQRVAPQKIASIVRTPHRRTILASRAKSVSRSA
jgi:hypothetical protein